MRVLVVVASYGKANDRYLARSVKEYHSMPFRVDVVVLSNENKAVPPGVELVVGLPDKNPWSLPFAHKRILADKAADYDLFIYSEDDILITERNIRAFLLLSASLPEDEIPGFLRFETGPDGSRSYPDFHVHFRWMPGSLRVRDGRTLAFFTNEHAACYLLTRRQLARAIASGGFLVQPHEGKYDLACTAATDPYTQCGMQKLVCVSDLDDFLVHHLPNKYVGKVGIEEGEFARYLKCLVQASESPLPDLYKTETKIAGRWYSKDYYEPVSRSFISLIPESSRTVLSVGCGWGKAEERIAGSGRRVVALALDSIMSAWAESRGVEVVHGSLSEAIQKIADQRFDCLLVSNLLHLAEDPARLLSTFVPLITDECLVVTSAPHLPSLKVLWRKMLRDEHFRLLGRYERSGMHIVSPVVLRRWFGGAGLRLERIVKAGSATVFGEGEIIGVGKKMSKTLTSSHSVPNGQGRRSRMLAGSHK